MAKALSNREAEVLELHNQGLNVKAIGDRLNISRFTVREYLRLARIKQRRLPWNDR